MARIGGSRRKRVNILTKATRKKGKISQKAYLQKFKEGDKVSLVIEPAVQKGVFHPRFSGRTGTILAREGKCYKVRITDLNSYKTLIVHPVHMKKL